METSPLDLIETGQVKGREALQLLQDTGNFVFHGTTTKIDSLEPRQARQINSTTGEITFDGEPAVFASNIFEPTIFKAIINRANIQAIPGDWSGWDFKDGQIFYQATKHLLDGAKKEGIKGYVMVFAKSDFEKHKGIEYKSFKEVKPITVVEVKSDDLPLEIQEVAPTPIK